MKKRKSFSLRPREGARETKLYNELGSWLKTTWVANGEGFFSLSLAAYPLLYGLKMTPFSWPFFGSIGKSSL